MVGPFYRVFIVNLEIISVYIGFWGSCTMPFSTDLNLNVEIKATFPLDDQVHSLIEFSVFTV